MSKDVEIKARVTRAQKATLQALADERGEGLSIILREAVREYLERRRPGETEAPAKQRAGGPMGAKAARGANPSSDLASSSVNEDDTPPARGKIPLPGPRLRSTAAGIAKTVEQGKRKS